MKSVIITGASKGIGHATALKFLAAGYRVFNLSRSAAATPGITDIAIDLASADFEAVITTKLLPQIASPEKLILIHNAAKLSLWVATRNQRRGHGRHFGAQCHSAATTQSNIPTRNACWQCHFIRWLDFVRKGGRQFLHLRHQQACDAWNDARDLPRPCRP